MTVRCYAWTFPSLASRARQTPDSRSSRQTYLYMILLIFQNTQNGRPVARIQTLPRGPLRQSKCRTATGAQSASRRRRRHLAALAPAATASSLQGLS